MFISAKLSGAKLNWTILEKEAFSVVFSLQKVHHIVYGTKIELITDSNPLHYMLNSKPSSPKLTRWALSLSRYDIDVYCISGKSNIIPDALSRLGQDR